MIAKINAIDNYNTFKLNGEKNVFYFFNYIKFYNFFNPTIFDLFNENIQHIIRQPFIKAVIK